MKAKLSLTVDASLLAFVDAEPGASRSEKFELIVRRYRQVRRDARLRVALATAAASADDTAETDAWRRVMEGASWSESAGATSGPSPSRPSRSRARR